MPAKPCPPEGSLPSPLPSPPSHQHALRDRVADLRASVSQAFAAALAAPRSARVPLEHRALRGQELVFKLQEQVLLPAVLQGLPRVSAAVTLAGREADLVRDLSMLLEALPHGAPASGEQRGELLAVIDGLASLNAARVDELLHDAPAAAVPWPALEAEVEAMLARWRDEWRRDGDIEDEDRDPVGLPPR